MELIWKPVLFRSWGSESASECSQFFRVVSLGGEGNRKLEEYKRTRYNCF